MKAGIVRLMLLTALLGAVSVATADTGEQVFAQHCAVCHQAEAQGMAGLAPPLKGSQWIRFARQREYIPGVPMVGMFGSLALENGTFTGAMPTQNRLSDEEIAAVINYLFKQVNHIEDWVDVSTIEIAELRKNPPTVAKLRALRKQALEK